MVEVEVEVEVVVISEEEEEAIDIDMMMLEDKEDGSRSASLLKLESLKLLRVLLVEFDDSTRSIIGALLRKSGYRVISVPDGLKAWETLKGRPQTIDLVLAEVELPSISGFSLLTMIMGDEICRNIPVIMMSSFDADSVVFKCMLRGAADFLVKPVRKNELRNLWQHVWRRNSVNSVGQSHSPQKAEASDETSSTKHSSHCVASHKQNKECSEKGSDAQSSCTKPDMEEDNTYMPNMQNLSQLKSSTETSYHKECVKVDGVLLMKENLVEDKSARPISEVAPCNNQSNYSVAPTPADEHAAARIMTRGIEYANIHIDTFHGKDNQLKPSREAMDLIGSFDNDLPAFNTHFQEATPNNLNAYSDPNITRNNCSSTPQLELSLRRSHFSDDEIRGVGEIKRLKHSNVSAFSRYNQQTVQLPVCNESNECASVSCIHQSDHTPSHTVEVPRHRVISVPLPVRSTKVDGLYGAVWPQLFYTPVGPLSLQSSKSVTQQEAVFHVYSSDQSNPENHDYQQSNCNSTNTTMHEQRLNVESFDDSRRVSAATAQSVTSSLCNSSSSNINSSECGSVCDGSNGNDNVFTIAGATTGCRNDLAILMPEGIRGTDSHRSNQREAALTKFRLKRKDRCFDKKVRYQSRKRLAEQRPRVKGQFVRQIPS